MQRQDILSTAKKHAITRNMASPDFFEGALLGNGNLGVVVCTRPDGIVLHLGHNDIWDVRICEDHKDKIGTFQEIWDKICHAKGDVHGEAWYQEYVKEVTSSYHDYKYPRPYPASSLYLFFDRKEYEVLGHSLDITNGLLTITLEKEDKEQHLIQIFVSQKTDQIFCRTVDRAGKKVSVFYRMLLVPNQEKDGLPCYERTENGFLQRLPLFGEEEQKKETDRAFAVFYRADGKMNRKGLDSRLEEMCQITVLVKHGLYGEICCENQETEKSWNEVWGESTDSWKTYWERSGIQLEDEFLERIWYWNTYFLRCVLNENSCCPGLFGNWMYQDIGTAWHGDYHFNYNTQQIFWGLMAANRAELHFPYLRLTENLLPVSKAWAKDFYQLRGACFPHSAYPVPMTVMPYPSPDWGWEIFETPWAVQSLWWHYTYTKDKELLRERIYPVMREAAQFLVDYMMREGANPHRDDKYHLFPTVVPELYGLSEGLKRNLDGTVDLALTKFLFKAILQAVDELNIRQQEEELIQAIEKILSAFPAYPTAESRRGEVYISVQNEDPDQVIYNCPSNLMQVFPGEDIDEQNGTKREKEIAKRSWRYHYNEGGNDLVFYYLIGARLGILDLEKFKRHVQYCMLPNGTAADLVTLTGGRYPDTMDFTFMARMGIWVENFALQAVVNECLLRGHGEVVELFPNWDKRKRASFCSLRVKGAFLVDADCSHGTVEKVKIKSELGGKVKIKNPWKQAVDENDVQYRGEILSFSMNPGQEIVLYHAERE